MTFRDDFDELFEDLIIGKYTETKSSKLYPERSWETLYTTEGSVQSLSYKQVNVSGDEKQRKLYDVFTPLTDNDGNVVTVNNEMRLQRASARASSLPEYRILFDNDEFDYYLYLRVELIEE